MLLMRFGLRVVHWGDLRAFATLLATFWRGAMARTGLAFVVFHPCLKNKGTARMGHPASSAFFGGLDDFSDISSMAFALRRTNSIVRFLELIACKVGAIILWG